MHSLGKKKKRFSLLFLEEGEMYTRDCMGFRHHADSYPEKRQEKGRVHICSRSIIFEPQDSQTPIVRYCYRDMQSRPEETVVMKSIYAYTDNNTRLTFSITKVIELPETRSPSAYKPVIFKSPQLVTFDFSYEKVSTVTTLVKSLYASNHSLSAGFDNEVKLEGELQQLEEESKFDTSRIESVSEKPVITNVKVQRIHPFMQLKGHLYMTDLRLYFQPMHQVSAHPVKSVKYSEITKLYKRRWRLRSLGFEVFTTAEKSIFLAFDNEGERDRVFDKLLSLVRSDCETENSVENMTLKWQLREISNFDYLLYLNSAAYRSFSDFTQYPVFPWVIASYDSEVLDLSNPSTFRDLSKPIGAINPTRLATFKKRYIDMPEPKFLYGTHYSAPGYVIGFLFRKFPLAMLRLHVKLT
jgi:factor associated with neutral sphingomyelinase activation